MNTNNFTIQKNVLTSNGIPPLTIDREEWLKRSRQTDARHPLDPQGICMNCGDHKIGFWRFVHFDPDDAEWDK